MSFRIQTVWAWLAIDPDDGDEGVMAFLQHGRWTPAIGADETRLKKLRPRVIEALAQTGLTARLARFDLRTDVEEVKG